MKSISGHEVAVNALSYDARTQRVLRRQLSVTYKGIEEQIDSQMQIAPGTSLKFD